MNNFRSVEFWKASIMILPENSFFELLRTVFGKIKTPFNKQALMGDLVNFLSRADIQKNIGAYINQNDAMIIAAAAALGEPEPEKLESFLAGEFGSAELQDMVINLEERFIIYRFQENGRRFLALNPVFEAILSPIIADWSLLFPSVPADTVSQTSEEFHFDDRILAALLSFVSDNEMFFKTDGSIRQKINNAAKTVFPGLPMETIVGALTILGLFCAQGETLTPDLRRFGSFGELDAHSRMEYCAAGIICHGENAQPENSSSWLQRAQLKNNAAFIHCFLDSLEIGRLYPDRALIRLAHILKKDDTGAYLTKFTGAMEKTGLLIRRPGEMWQKPEYQEKQNRNSALIVMDTPFTFIAYPEIAYNDIIRLAAVSHILEAGLNVRFELSRESVLDGFTAGIAAQEIIEALQRLSHNRIDDNLIFTLQDWEKRFREVTLRKGLVLTLSPELRYLAETRQLSRLITETIAPGVYLLPETAETKTVDTLRKSGVSITARRRNARAAENGQDGNTFNSCMPDNFYPPLQEEGYQTETIRYSPRDFSPASALTDDFYSILNKINPGAEEKDELAARIGRRLILNESQLHGAAIRYEKLEARGLDYTGKALIAKQAVSMQSPVEVIWPGRQKQERVFGIAKTLEKSGGETVLIIDPLNDTGNTVRVSLGKISLLRRIKKSIFEGG